MEAGEGAFGRNVVKGVWRAISREGDDSMEKIKFGFVSQWL